MRDAPRVRAGEPCYSERRSVASSFDERISRKRVRRLCAMAERYSVLFRGFAAANAEDDDVGGGSGLR